MENEREAAVQSDDGFDSSCSLQIFLEFESTNIQPICEDEFDPFQNTPSDIDPLDLNDANILINIINSETINSKTEQWTGWDMLSMNEDLIFETDVHTWPTQTHNLTPLFTEEFIMKTPRLEKQHYTRIALFQVCGTVFYWGRMYEDKDYKEGVWNWKNFQYFKLGFRNDVERFIEQYLKIFSLSNTHPVQCTYVRPNRAPHTITLYKNQDQENRKRKSARKNATDSRLWRPRKPRSASQPWPRVKRQPLKPKQARVKERKARGAQVKCQQVTDKPHLEMSSVHDNTEEEQKPSLLSVPSETYVPPLSIQVPEISSSDIKPEKSNPTAPLFMSNISSVKDSSNSLYSPCSIPTIPDRSDVPNVSSPNYLPQRKQFLTDDVTLQKADPSSGIFEVSVKHERVVEDTRCQDTHQSTPGSSEHVSEFQSHQNTFQNHQDTFQGCPGTYQSTSVSLEHVSEFQNNQNTFQNHQDTFQGCPGTYQSTSVSLEHVSEFQNNQNTFQNHQDTFQGCPGTYQSTSVSLEHVSEFQNNQNTFQNHQDTFQGCPGTYQSTSVSLEHVSEFQNNQNTFQNHEDTFQGCPGQSILESSENVSEFQIHQDTFQNFQAPFQMNFEFPIQNFHTFQECRDTYQQHPNSFENSKSLECDDGFQSPQVSFQIGYEQSPFLHCQNIFQNSEEFQNNSQHAFQNCPNTFESSQDTFESSQDLCESSQDTFYSSQGTFESSQHTPQNPQYYEL